MIKSLLLTMVLCALTANVFAAKSPFGPKLQKELKSLGKEKVARALLSVNSTLDAGDTVGTNVVIPAGAVISDAFVYVDTQVVSGSDNTINFYCGGIDLLEDIDMTNSADDALVQGAQTAGTIASYDYQASNCNITASIGSGDSGVTAGKLYLFVRYSKIVD